MQVHAGAGHQVLDWNQNVTVPLLEQMNKTESKTKQKRSTTNTWHSQCWFSSGHGHRDEPLVMGHCRQHLPPGAPALPGNATSPSASSFLPPCYWQVSDWMCVLAHRDSNWNLLWGVGVGGPKGGAEGGSPTLQRSRSSCQFGGRWPFRHQSQNVWQLRTCTSYKHL